jgi:hypothetical protein
MSYLPARLSGPTSTKILHTAALPARVDIDAMQFRLSSIGVVVQVAEHDAVLFGYQELRIACGRAPGDALRERLHRIGLFDHGRVELCSDNLVVYRRKADSS